MRRKSPGLKLPLAITFLARLITPTLSQNCISLAGSTQCSAFNASSISTSSGLSGQFPFLAFVSNTQQFDDQLSRYISTNYVQQKYQQLLGCDNVNLTNTTNLYARYTTSVICNSIVQQSIQPCSLSTADARPLCAASCAQQATSEEAITVNSQLCGRPNQNFLDQIRADFTNCALPSDSLSTRCVTGEENEPNDCGFSSNLQGLCGYCAASSPNATDSCCVGSNVTARCEGVTLPTFSLPPLFPSSTSGSTPSATGSSQNAKTSSSSHHGLSGGQIAGIAVGSVAVALIILAVILLCCTGMFGRWRNRHQRQSIFNQPSPPRRGGPGMAIAPPPPSKVQVSQTGAEPQSGGRVTRMAALTGNTSESPSSGNGTAAAGGRRYGDSSESDGYGDTPGSARGGHPVTGKRHGSLSSQSMLGALDDHSSPNSGSGGQYSSPEGVASGQSEQLPSFKDYYSHDDIHPGDAVATLWAYQPRAGDEFELERGDMLKIVGLWDDGWATGVRLNERAETYIAARRIQRDSGMSQGPGRRGESASPTGMIKAFPLVCVCLPDHWKATVEGDGPEEPGFAS
ncbi:MAG: hypothetical protein L6R37_002007 [Teloschistes peruensis]|nr:MAG: hypothetical protein L6R37_002007 [Teloschistes peruensis]